MKHSKYSPSAMAAILACPAYATVNEGKGDAAGVAAQLGANCHEWAETLFHSAQPELEPVPENCQIEDWQEDCTRDMVRMAIDFVEGLCLTGEYETATEILLGNPENDIVFGTADLVIRSEDGKHLIILDYKTGKGIDVSPEWNAQLLTYAWLAVGRGDVPGEITLCIAQPRTNPELKIWSCTGNEFKMWREETFLPGLKKAKADDPERIPGDTQCRWCVEAATCPIRRNEMIGLLDKPADPPDGLNEIAKRLPEFRQWLKSIEKAIQNHLEDGKPLADFKLVRGRSNRRWKDLEEAEKFLKNRRLKMEERFNQKLISPAQAEKKLKGVLTKRTENKLKALIEKPEGKLTWALKTDKREEVLINPPETELASIDDLL